MMENFSEIVDNASSLLSVDELDLDLITENIKEQVEELMESSSELSIFFSKTFK